MTMAAQAAALLRAAPLTALILLLALPAAAHASRNGSKDALRGERIFNGRETVAARLDGHDRALPPQLGKCAACHRPAQPSTLEADLAPPLAHDLLTTARPRRGGKPFAYDQASFCATVRTGIDPQYVILRRAMPRFEVSQEQCAALWTYLTEKNHERKQ